MSEPQLSVRSAKARAMARKFAKEDRRSITQIVEISLELYGERRARKKQETADAFFDRLVRENHIEGDADIDLESIIRENRKPRRPVEL
jgi:hypothetical protein